MFAANGGIVRYRGIISAQRLFPRWGVIAMVVGTVAVAAPAGSATQPVHMFLYAVTCPSMSNCIAAGTYRLGDTGNVVPGVAQWNGTKWTTTAVPVPPDPPSSKGDSRSHGTLYGVACANTTTCFAVGSYTILQRVRALIDRWDGKHWVLAARPRPAGATSSELRAVSCASPSSCVAVGTATVTGSGVRTFAAHWNGAQWSVTPTPSRNHARLNELDGVSCATATNCFAVGTYEGTRGQPLVEHWDGTSWSLVAPAAASGVLRSVSCISATSCYAAGTPPSYGKVLIERWNGTTWSIANAAKPGQSEDIIDLYAVSCAGPNQCFATGGYQGPHGRAPLFERWDGLHWKPAPASGRAVRYEMHGVACRSATFCVAVYGSVVDRWNGSTWSVDRSAP